MRTHVHIKPKLAYTLIYHHKIEGKTQVHKEPILFHTNGFQL